jgi:hypothetical protein
MIPKGYLGTRRTVAHIQALIRAGTKNFYVRQKAIDILLERGVRPKDYLGEVKALFEWVQRYIRYTKDPFRLEVLHSARRMLELRAGDCDDFSILLGAMLEAIGHPVRLVVTGPDPLRPRLFSHVYLEVYYRGRWIPLDATMPHSMGWAPRSLVRQVFPLERRSQMLSQDVELQGAFGAEAVPDWLRGFLRAVHREAIPPRDPRVKSLWDLLRQRQLLGRSPWLRAVLRLIWTRGLAARPRPWTTRRLVRRLRRWGILPPRMVAATERRPLSFRPRRIQSRAVRPVGRVQPGNGHAVPPVRLQPVASMAARPLG